MQLPFILPTHCWNDGENADLAQGLDLCCCAINPIVNVMFLREHDKRIVVAQGVIDVDAEDALPMFLLLVEIGYQVETLVAVEAVIVAAFDMVHHVMIDA